MEITYYWKKLKSTHKEIVDGTLKLQQKRGSKIIIKTL